MSEYSNNSVKTVNRIWDETVNCLWEEILTVTGNSNFYAELETIDPQILIKHVEYKNGKIKVNCGVIYQLVFWNEEYGCRSFLAEREYTVEKETKEEGQVGTVYFQIESFTAELIGGGKVRCHLNVTAKINCKAIHEIVFLGEQDTIDDMELKTEEVNLFRFIDTEEEKLEIEEKISVDSTISRISEILFYTVTIEGQEEQIHGNAIWIKANVKLQICFLDQDEKGFHVIQKEMPISREIRNTESNEHQQILSNIYLNSISIQTIEDNDGELRQFYVKLDMTSSCEVFEEENFRILADAYSANLDAVLSEETYISMQQIKASPWPVRKMISLPGEEKKEIIFTTATIGEYRLNHQEDELWVEGDIRYILYYHSIEGPEKIEAYRTDIPFRKKMNADWKEKSQLALEIHILKIGWNRGGDGTVDIWCECSEDIRLIQEQCHKRVISFEDVVRAEEEILQPGLKIYFAQRNEDIWKIGKKYRKPIDFIKRYNPHLGDEILEPHTQVVIVT